MTEYGPALRSIGQALERLGAEDFDLEMDGEAFLVRCRLSRPKATAAAEPDQAAILRHIWGVLPGQSTVDLDMTLFTS